MKFSNIAALLLLPAFAMTACSDDILEGAPTMDVKANLEKAYFGDSIPFTVKASDPEVALSTLKAELFFGEELVSEKTLRTKVSGADYTDTIFVPYMANIPDGNATLRLTLQNINFTKKIQEYSIPIAHPDYQSLKFVTEDGTEYNMRRMNQYEYAVTDKFPQEIKGKIVAPKFGENGNELTFGYESSEIKVGADGMIPFSNASAGKYTISFNSYSFQGAPFTILTFNDQRLEQIDNTHFQIDLNLDKGTTLTPSGFPNYSDWWIDPDYFVQNPDGTLAFNAYAGTYRIIADLTLQYFRVYKLNGSEPATLNSDGTGAVWVIGEHIGFPSVSSNQVGWTTENALCMAPVGDKTYQMTLVGGKTVDTDVINFKFFHQMGWGGEFGASTLTTTSDLIHIGDGTGGSNNDNGNIYLAEGKKLETNGVYVFTLNLQGGSGDGILTIDYKGEQQFVEKPIWVNGTRMWTSDNSSYTADIELKQGSTFEFKGFDNLAELYVDPDYFTFDDEEYAVKFNPVDGKYKVTLNRTNRTLSAVRLAADGSEATLGADGSGALWLMGWGVGSPSQSHQFGWDKGNAYCMAEIAPKVYQFTGSAGPEKGSSIGDRFRTDYLSFNFYFDNEKAQKLTGDYALTSVGDASKYVKLSGEYVLAGTELEKGAEYRITVDFSKGIEQGTINMVKL